MIKLQFVTEDGFESWMIRRCTFSEFSHVDAILPSWHPQAGQLLGARLNGGVQIRKPGYAKFTRVLVATAECTTQQELTYYQFLYQRIGRPYDWQAILNFGIERDWHNSKGDFCSEIQQQASEAAGIPWINPAVDSYRVTPQDLLKSIRLNYSLGVSQGITGQLNTATT